MDAAATLIGLARANGFLNDEQAQKLAAQMRQAADRFGKFELVEKLGEGGMGEVWKAWQTDLGRWVAIKFVKGDDPEDVARFIREAQTAAKLSHPNIVATYEAGELDGRHFIAMDYIEGDDLKKRRVDAKQALELIRDAADAVHYAHEQGIIHRDLKPQNLMLSDRGRLVVMDFGLAKSAAAPGLSQSGTIVGTPYYMPPEQARGEKVDARSDVYSLGATLYELVTGHPPFEGESILDVLRKVNEEEPIPPRADRDIVTIIHKAMEKEPGKRYATAKDLADDLRRELAGEPIAARPLSSAGRLVKRVKRNPIPYTLGALLALALVGIAAVTVGQRIHARTKAIAEADARTSHADKLLAGLPEPPIPDPERPMAQERPHEERARLEVIDRLVEADGELRSALESLSGITESRRGKLQARRYDVNRALGLYALRGADYALARLALSQCAALDAPRHDREKLAEVAQRAREAVLKFRRKQIESALADLREGLDRKGRDESGPAVEDYVFEAVTYRDEQTVDLLSEALKPLAAKAKAGGKETVWTQPERDVMTFCVRVLGRLDLDSSVAPLANAMETLWDLRLTVECGEALCNTRRASAHGPLVAAVDRLGLNSNEWLQIARGFGRVPPPADEREPRTADEYYARTLIRRDKRDFDGAIEDASRAIELDPKFALAFLNRGNVRSDKGDIVGAIEDYSRAIELDPECVEAFVSRGASRGEQGDLDGAIEDLTRAIELDPKYAAAFDNRGAARQKKGDLDGAIKDISRAIELDPKNAFAFTNRGNALQDKGDLDGAIKDYSRAIELDPRLVNAFTNRGIARRQNGDINGAIEDCCRAIELEPKNATAFANRGQARWDKGDLAGAVVDWEKFLELAPADPQAPEVREAIRKSREQMKKSEDY